MRWTSARPSKALEGYARCLVSLSSGAPPLDILVDCFTGRVEVWNAIIEKPIIGQATGLLVPGPVSVRVVTRYELAFVFVAGQLVASWRRQGGAPPAISFTAPTAVTMYAQGGSIGIDGVHVETLSAFAGRGSASVIERQLPGLPPASGLRAQYWAWAAQSQWTGTNGQQAMSFPYGVEPAGDRLEPTLNSAPGTAPPKVGGPVAARWQGAIYLDLVSSDRNVRLNGLYGNARLYVGSTRRDQPAATNWYFSAATGGAITTGALRASLGEVAGWFPIVIELVSASNEVALVLEDRAGVGAYGIVPQARLSPIGCYTATARYSNHRQEFDNAAKAFGYQWRVEPCSMESGQFPGQLSARAINGRLTNVTVDDENVGTEGQVQGSATDVVDGIIADAAGLATPQGPGQLSVQSVDYTRAPTHLMLRQAYESISEIGDEGLARTRIDSLLDLRSSPNEQVGVRPRGQRDVVDTFALEGTVGRFDWRPGDGVLLALDQIDVLDRSPRQFTTVGWPLKPDGVGAPTVGFRQRPRNARTELRRLASAIYGPRRNYQGQIVSVTGSYGGATYTGTPEGGAVDSYSRVMLPPDASQVIRLWAALLVAGGPWRLEVGNVDLGGRGGVPTSGRYDLTAYARSASSLIGAGVAWARLIGATSGSYTIVLEAEVVV
jgi:hypothetical protein